MVKNIITFENEIDLAEILEKSDINMTKLYLVYELKERHCDIHINKTILDILYQMYLDSGYISDIIHFVNIFDNYLVHIGRWVDFNNFDDFDFDDFIIYIMGE